LISRTVSNGTLVTWDPTSKNTKIVSLARAIGDDAPLAPPTRPGKAALEAKI
jgi:hypothetical protein